MPEAAEPRVCHLDMHIHTVASPCAELEMLPSLIVERALALGLDAIAITDHNTAANVSAVMRCAQTHGLAVIPGMEVQTREEVHLLCYFDTLDQVLAWQEIVYAALPGLRNREDLFGSQLVVDENDEFIRKIDRLLLVATHLSVEQVVDQVTQLGGVVVAAHVNRQAYSLLAVLGFIPSDLALAALEISRIMGIAQARQRFPQLKSWPLITNSDAHRLSEMQCSQQLVLQDSSIKSILKVWQLGSDTVQ